MVSIVQNDHIQFSFLQNTYLGITQAVTSILSTTGFWYFQRWRKISTKRMFQITNLITVVSCQDKLLGSTWADFATLGVAPEWDTHTSPTAFPMSPPRYGALTPMQIIPFWGMLGLWTNKIGFRKTWEFYAYK